MKFSTNDSCVPSLNYASILPSSLPPLLPSTPKRTFCWWTPLLCSVVVLICLLLAGPVSAEGETPRRCLSCEQRAFEDYKKMRQEEILKDLLKKLDLPSKPNVTVDYDNLPPIGRDNPRIQALLEQSRRESQHRRVRKWRRRYSGAAEEQEEEQEYYPALYETEEELPPQTSYILAQAVPSWFGQDAALFKFSPALRKKFISSAKLNVFLRRPDELAYSPIPLRLNIYRRYPNGTLSPKLVSKHLELSFDGPGQFEQVEVPLDEMMVQQWVETVPRFEASQSEDEMDGETQEEDGQGPGPDALMDERQPSVVALFVEARHEGENLVQYPNNGDEDGAGGGPDASMFLELELVNMKAGRSRRNTNICRPGQNNTGCCLYDLVIDFEKIGWTFVVAPKRYNAYVCSGECNGNIGPGTSLGRSQAAVAARIDHFQCCHPKEFNTITILYVSEHNEVMIRQVPNMVAKACGCT